MYVQAPSLLDVGGVNVKVFVLVVTAGIDHLVAPVAGVSETARSAVEVPRPYFVVAACVAVIRVVPAVMTVTTSPAIVATSVSELVYVQAPSLLDVGGVNVKVFGSVVTAGIDHGSLDVSISGKFKF